MRRFCKALALESSFKPAEVESATRSLGKLWVNVDRETLTPTEARKLAMLLLTGADYVEKAARKKSR